MFKEIAKIFHRNRSEYISILKTFIPFTKHYLELPQELWSNTFFPPLDAICLFGMLSYESPSIYLEVGSGNSTKFADQAKKRTAPEMKIISIDPAPRAEIDALCDEVHRTPLEKCDLSLFEALQPFDILFIDGSHRLTPELDVKFFFFEILPRLRSGVIIHLHDIFLPYDYPEEWKTRQYTEQYLLASLLLFAQSRFDVFLPNFFLYKSIDLDQIFVELKQTAFFSKLRLNGGSFWFRKK